MTKTVSERHTNPFAASQPQAPPKDAPCASLLGVRGPAGVAPKPRSRKLVKRCAATGMDIIVRLKRAITSLPELLAAPPAPPAGLGRLLLAAPQGEPQTLTAHLDRRPAMPQLQLCDADVPSIPVEAAAVAGLADGAPVELVPAVILPESVIYQLSATAPAFATSMVGRVSQDKTKRLWVEALQPRGPFCRLALEPYSDATPGDVVVATLDTPECRLARVVGKLEEPPSPMTAVCAIAADCGARFGHDPGAVGHAYNIRVEQSCRGPGMLDVPFFTLDPKGAKVLDQAMHLERNEAGYLLQYAIADGGALVPEGSLCDAEAARRGAALYLPVTLPPELATSLHLMPRDITQDAGSLLEEQNRPALVFSVKLDAQCNIVDCTAQRTVIRSVQQVSTQQVQWYYDHQMSGKLVATPFAPALALLREVGEKLVDRAKRRGATRVLQKETNVAPDPVPGPGNVVRTFENHDAEASQYNGHISMVVNEAVAAKLAEAGVMAPFLGDATTPAQGTTFAARARPHKAIGLPAYINVTAPLRRYQDMVTQRIADAVLTGAQPVPYQSEGVMAAVIASANIGRERQRLIHERTRSLRAAAWAKTKESGVS